MQCGALRECDARHCCSWGWPFYAMVGGTVTVCGLLIAGTVFFAVRRRGMA